MEKKKPDVLAEIRRKFPKRPKKQGKSFPLELRRLVLFALRSGHKPGVVAAAAGVSKQSVSHWIRSDALGLDQAPVELKLVDCSGAVENADKVAAMARLHLRSGAVLEIPVSSLDERLLAILGGGAP